MDEPRATPRIWIDRTRTLCDKDQREAYLELLNSQLCWSFPEFVRNLRSQSPHEREMSRVAVIEHRSDTQRDSETFKSSRELQDYLEKAATTETSTPPRRLFILEDLALNHIEVLGSKLRIPPTFFGAHWADPATPTFNHRNPFRRYSEDTFVIRYPSTQPIRIDASPELHGTIYHYISNVNRHIHCYDPKGPIIDQPKSYHALSFWTSGIREDGSWDSVLIVDPPVGDYVKSLADGTPLKVDRCSNEYAYSRMHSLAPDFNNVHILPSDPSDWTEGWQRPQYNSMFDDILSLSHCVPARAVGPKTCTEIARKLMICTFITFLRRRILNMLRLQNNPRIAEVYVNRCDYLREFGHGVLSSWHHELFGFVVNVKYIMGIVAQEAEEHVVALGLNRPTTIDIPQWEQDGWITINDNCRKIIGMADSFLQSYLQFTSMQEAQAANKNALSLARITNLTMIFIPLSTVAAIFAMTDDFLPGKSKSWVFWITALPVLFVTSRNVHMSPSYCWDTWKESYES
ncbi:hypothetical protein EJ02DRAFT_473619 [Clathrospora elynae]|uniref:Cora-domain-containing protein n=1 Tax=Clathrospora elynae TaxID=706981 RepID=A0A6A5SEF6_9PLEO|nr:hypothetical protein EJ02DRAFT_473619 [Clathrospora elynae]